MENSWMICLQVFTSSYFLKRNWFLQYEMKHNSTSMWIMRKRCDTGILTILHVWSMKNFDRNEIPFLMRKQGI